MSYAENTFFAFELCLYYIPLRGYISLSIKLSTHLKGHILLLVVCPHKVYSKSASTEESNYTCPAVRLYPSYYIIHWNFSTQVLIKVHKNRINIT